MVLLGRRKNNEEATLVVQIKDDGVLNYGKDNGDGETSKDIKDVKLKD